MTCPLLNTVRGSLPGRYVCGRTGGCISRLVCIACPSRQEPAQPAPPLIEHPALHCAGEPLPLRPGEAKWLGILGVPVRQ